MICPFLNGNIGYNFTNANKDGDTLSNLMKTFFDLIFILNGAIGFICFILVMFSIKSNRTVNIYLAIMVFGASFRFIGRGYLDLTNQVEYIADFSRSISYVFGFALPCLYFKHLVFPKKVLNTKVYFTSFYRQF